MSDLVEIIETLLLTPPAADEAQTSDLLKNVAGRGAGQYGARLKDWLESDLSIYPEPITVQLIDNPDDRGIDVLVTGRRTGLRVGFQIKSDNDLKADQDKFVREAKAQYAEAGVWGLALYVFVMACRITPGNVRKYTYLQNTFALMPNKNVLWLDPSRAAGLLRAFSSPLPMPAPRPKGWAEFFVSVRQRNLADVYLNELPGLPPHERFQPPSQWNELVSHTDSLPLTILTGPPATGKTFAALQLLWRAFQQGRKALWVAPPRPMQTEGPIADSIGMQDMRERIDLVTRELGLHAHRPPLDAAEFIAAHLEPDSLVYIEDPFGKLDDEFEHSLHTYKFFDLDRFVSALGAGEPRSTCHILITSREGVFERWLNERRQQGRIPPDFAIVRIGPDSYSSAGRTRLITKLLRARGIAEPEEAALSIEDHVDVPFDATLIARDIETSATLEQVIASAEKLSHQYASKLSGLVSVETDAERLFLMLLSAFSTGGSGRHDFYTAYELLYKAIGIGGDVYTDIQSSLARHRPLFTRLDIMRIDALDGILSEHADFHLEPVHSTVNEGINGYLIDNAIELLDKVALALPEIEKHPLSNSAEKLVGIFILRLAFHDLQEKSKDAIFAALYGPHGGAHLDIPELLSLWNILPNKYKEGFFDYIAKQNTSTASEACATLTRINLPEQDAWRMLQLLAEHPGLGTMHFRIYGDPWGYLSEHIDQIPPDLRQHLDKEASAHPATFTYALANVIVTRWSDVSQEWRDAFMHAKSMRDVEVQERVLTAIAKSYNEVPEELRQFLDRQGTNPDYLIRAATAIAALLAYRSAPEKLGPMAMKVAGEPDVRAPLYVLTRTRGDGSQYLEFVRILLERANRAAAACLAACLLNILLYDGKGEPKPRWKFEAARACVAIGGKLARAVLAYNSFDHQRGSAALGYSPLTTMQEEPSQVRLAWVWSYANTAGRKPNMTVEETKELIKGLDEHERLLAINYLTAQAQSLPREIRELVEGFETAGEPYKRAIEEGRTHQQPKEHGRTTWSFPSEQFFAGEQKSIYDSLLDYTVITVPVMKDTEQKDMPASSQAILIHVMGHPLLDYERV
jgi:hypothetical protein